MTDAGDADELRGRSERREREVTTLLDASRAVLEVQDFPRTARIIFDEACKITGARSGYIALLSKDGSENEVLFLEAGGLPCTVDPELPMPIRGLRAEAYKTKGVVFENDFMGSEWTSYLPGGHVAMRNVLFAPLTIGGEVRGVMGLANKPTDFTERDRAMAAALGELAAIALRNARDLQKLNATVAELERALSEVKTLRGIIPICSSCKRVRTEAGEWQAVELYVSQHSEGDFSHGICEACREKLYGDIFDEE